MAQPVILIDPILTIDGTALECYMSHIELNPDVEVVEVTTSCGVKEYPGPIKWTLNTTLYHSHDVDGTNAILTAAVEGGVPVPFTVVSSSAPISATNPEYVGEVIPRSFAPINGDVGEASEVDLEWSIQGWGTVPTTNIVPVAAGTASAKKKTVDA